MVEKGSERDRYGDAKRSKGFEQNRSDRHGRSNDEPSRGKAKSSQDKEKKSTGNERTGTVLEERRAEMLGKGEEHLGLGKAMKDDDGTGTAKEQNRMAQQGNCLDQFRRSMDRQGEDA